MREIKFRGWNPKNKCWLHGFYLMNRGAHFVCPDEFANGKSWDDYEILPETLGQFTGLTDKHGQEIYEGDILHDYYSGDDYKVHFDVCSFDARCINDDCERLLDDVSSDSEVIGNIHDNLDLLK